MKLFDRAIDKIDENRNKEFNCIPFDKLLPKFSEYLPGITQKTYYIVTASSKVGKSQISDFMFLYHPYNFIKTSKDKIKLKIFYFSLEMDIETKLIAGIGKKLYDDYKIIAPVKQLLSQGKNRVSGELWDKIISLREYFEELEDILIINDGNINPTGIYKQMYKYATDNGTILKKRVNIKHEDTGADDTLEVFDRYIPNNPDEYVIIITDHLAELTCERGWGIKDTMEKHSDYMRILRNMFGYIPVDIQQQSASQESLDKFKAGKLEPSVEGLGESKLTARKANIILGLFSPYMHEIADYRGYDITKLKDNYRNLSIIRQRNDISSVNLGLYFNGACNYFSELPLAKNMTPQMYSKL